MFENCLTYDELELYAVFVYRVDADAFQKANPAWRVEWCAEQGGECLPQGEK